MLKRKQLLIVPMLCLMGAAGVRADSTMDQKTVEQAVWLLEKSTLVHSNGFHNILLRALRQLRDPRLKPLFSELVQRRHPALKIHGILGLAEISDPPKLDLALVADIKSTAVQAQLVSAAIDGQLLSTEDAKQLATWPTLDPAVRVLVTSQLVADKQKFDPDVLDDALASDNPAMRGMAALLKAQMGEPGMLEVLKKIDEEPGPARDKVRSLLLQTAMRYDFAIIAPWAMEMLTEKNLDRDVTYQALRTALMFNAPESVNAWMHRFDEASVPEREADRLRLAVLALDIADRLDARVFRPLIDHEDPLLKQIGVTGDAIARKQPHAEHVAKLVKMNNLLTSRWAVQYAVKLADEKPEQARPILMAIIEAADDDNLANGDPDRKPRFAPQRLEHAVAAVQKLHEKDKQGGTLLAGMVRDAPMLMQEAMIMGLIRSTGDKPDQVIDGMDDFKSTVASAMAVLLRTKHTDTMSDEQREALSRIVRGGGGLQDPLRIQAAWTYLRLTQQDRVALAKVLGDGL